MKWEGKVVSGKYDEVPRSSNEEDKVGLTEVDIEIDRDEGRNEDTDFRVKKSDPWGSSLFPRRREIFSSPSIINLNLQV